MALVALPVMLPIPGTSSVEHLEENVVAASLDLDEENSPRSGNGRDRRCTER
jgi:aryl-alcohol dehydrogenase-like predicted oxidoreductase